MRKIYNNRNRSVLLHNTNDLIYLAGFFDGEGHISLSKKHTGHYDINFMIGNTNLEVLKWISVRFGGSITPNKNNGKEGMQNIDNKWKNIYYWFADKTNLKHFLSELIPFLIVKKKQAELLQEYLTYRKRSCKLEEYRLWQEKIKDDINALNHNSNYQMIENENIDNESMFNFE